MTIHYKGVAHPWFCDVMGHMTTRFYVGMFDDASYHFISDAFGSVVSNSQGWADVKHEIEYLDEVASGDLLEVSGSLVKLGGKSMIVRYEMFNRTRNKLAATLVSTSVLFDLNERKAILISDEMRAQAQAMN